MHIVCISVMCWKIVQCCCLVMADVMLAFVYLTTARICDGDISYLNLY